MSDRKKSSAANLEAAMTSKGTRKNLSDYFISPKTPRKNMQGINAAVKRDGIKKIGNAFLIRRGGKYKPYVRKSSGKWGIEPIISPAIPQIMKNPEIDAVSILLQERMPETFIVTKEKKENPR